MAKVKKRAGQPSRLLQQAGEKNEILPESYKLSAVFLEFMAPYVTDNMRLEERQQYYEIGMMAWNLSFFPPHERLRLLMPTLQPMPVEDQLEIKNFFSKLIERRLSMFSEYNRAITDFELIDEGNEYRLFVLSTSLQQSEKPGEV